MFLTNLNLTGINNYKTKKNHSSNNHHNNHLSKPHISMIIFHIIKLTLSVLIVKLRMIMDIEILIFNTDMKQSYN